MKVALRNSKVAIAKLQLKDVGYWGYSYLEA
jgi:hypothetical protein